MGTDSANKLKLDIAVGKHRRDKNWKNRQTTWEKLAQRLSEPHVTHETFAEYVSGKPDYQANIKDVGGFVGGYLTGGRRKSGSVQHRQVVTIDADFARNDTWDSLTLLYDCAACIYSTHKHEAKAPRYRIVLPLDRPVSPDEYCAIARRVAGDIGIDQFDPTGFQVERLMYWPSVSKDGEFFYQLQDGAALCADDVLATYTDWSDTSEWPICDREAEIIKKGQAKQGDPLEKPGMIGAFCRTYDMHQTIEKFLPDVYEVAEGHDDRYTYKYGSTAAGLIVFDAKFAYSHHGTDPIGGKLCNAFDLVRLHKFGLLDEDIAPDTPINKRPSYDAMAGLAGSDELVRVTMVNERLEDAREDFTDYLTYGGSESFVDDAGNLTIDLSSGAEGVGQTAIIDAPQADFIEDSEIEDLDSEEWKKTLDADKRGIAVSINNVLIILNNDRLFKKAIWFDEFEGRGVFKRRIPWRVVTYQERFITDMDIDSIEHYIETAYDMKGVGAKLLKALSVLFQRNRFHPVRNYLQGLEWDGVERLDAMLIDYMGAEDTPYVRAVTRKTMCAAVARVNFPGVKFDNVLTLVGKQGTKKSTLIDRLAGKWFSDSFNFHMLKSKEAAEAIQGVWIVEVAELAGMAKTEVEAIKAFISARKDRYRAAFGKLTQDRYRQCVFIASTNMAEFLRDTANRRFWPVKVNKGRRVKDPGDLTADVRGQLWAEAVVRFKEGETLFLPEELNKQAEEVQEAHMQVHPWTYIIEDYLDNLVPENWHTLTSYARRDWLTEDEAVRATGNKPIDRVCVTEIWEVALRQRDPIDEKSDRIIRVIMSNLVDWEQSAKALRFGIYGRQRRGYQKIAKNVWD